MVKCLRLCFLEFIPLWHNKQRKFKAFLEFCQRSVSRGSELARLTLVWAQSTLFQVSCHLQFFYDSQGRELCVIFHPLCLLFCVFQPEMIHFWHMLFHCIDLEEKIKGKFSFPSCVQPMMYCDCENTCDLADCYFIEKSPTQTNLQHGLAVSLEEWWNTKVAVIHWREILLLKTSLPQFVWLPDECAVLF